MRKSNDIAATRVSPVRYGVGSGVARHAATTPISRMGTPDPTTGLPRVPARRLDPITAQYRRLARLQRYEEITAVAWMLFAILCCVILTVAAGTVVGLVYDKITWNGG